MIAVAPYGGWDLILSFVGLKQELKGQCYGAFTWVDHLFSQRRAFVSDCLPSCPPLSTSSATMVKSSLYLALLCPYAAASRSMLPPMSDRMSVNPVPNLSARKMLPLKIHKGLARRCGKCHNP